MCRLPGTLFSLYFIWIPRIQRKARNSCVVTRMFPWRYRLDYELVNGKVIRWPREKFYRTCTIGIDHLNLFELNNIYSFLMTKRKFNTSMILVPIAYCNNVHIPGRISFQCDVHLIEWSLSMDYKIPTWILKRFPIKIELCLAMLMHSTSY